MLDPGLKEEAARDGALTVVANVHKELCAVHKADGIGLSLPQVRADAARGRAQGILLAIGCYSMAAPPVQVSKRLQHSIRCFLLSA